MKNTKKNTMKKILGILMAVAILFLAAVPAFAEDHPLGLLTPAWVNCADGKTLNFRAAPGGKIVGHLECGTELYVKEYKNNGWTEVVLKNGKTGFVKTKFLQDKKPGKYEITEREDNFKTVAKEYTVTAKALNKKTAKSVGLRVKPNKTAKAIRTLQAGDELIVLAKGKTWMKVQDKLTGETGFVANDYVA